MTAICCNVESSINEDDYELNRLHHPVTTTTVTLKVLARKITVVTENQSKNKYAPKSQFQFQSWSWIQRCLDLDWWRRILFVCGNEVDVGRDKLLCCVLRFKVKLLYVAEYSTEYSRNIQRNIFIFEYSAEYSPSISKYTESVSMTLRAQDARI